MYFQVVLIDYGLEYSIDISKTRELPSYFLKIPPFCQRAHLDILSLEEANLIPVRYKPTSEGWPRESKKIFRDYVTGYSCLDPTYFAWQPNPESVIRLKHFNQVRSYI